MVHNVLPLATCDKYCNQSEHLFESTAFTMATCYNDLDMSVCMLLILHAQKSENSLSISTSLKSTVCIEFVVDIYGGTWLMLIVHPRKLGLVWLGCIHNTVLSISVNDISSSACQRVLSISVNSWNARGPMSNPRTVGGFSIAPAPAPALAKRSRSRVALESAVWLEL